jgi:hypothetical protein
MKVADPSSIDAEVINKTNLAAPPESITAELDNVEYLYDHQYYGQYMKPDVPQLTPVHNDLDDIELQAVRFASDAKCINGEHALYRHAYNRAYFGVRPETIPMPNLGVDALVTMTHWAFVDGQYSCGEVQIWTGRPGEGIDPAVDYPSIIIYGEREGDKFGIDVRSAGDFNGNGHEDLLIAAPLHNTFNEDGSVNVAGGVIYLIFISKIDLSDRPVKLFASEIGKSVPGIRFEFGGDGARYPGWGLSMDRVRFGSKRFSSAVIGSFDLYPAKRRSEQMTAPAFPPRVYALHGNDKIPDFVPCYRVGIDDGLHGINVTKFDLSAFPIIAGGMNMTIMGVGDLDGDGFEEFALSASDGSEASGSYIFYGGAMRRVQRIGSLEDAELHVRIKKPLELDENSTLRISGLQGATIVNDFDGDGLAEVCFAAPNSYIVKDNKRSNVGAVGLMRAGKKRVGSIEFADLDFIIHGEAGKTVSMGKQNSVRSADITNNGYADILINDWKYNEDCCGRNIQRGRFWLVEGGRDKQKVMSLPTEAKLTYVADLKVPGLFGYGWTTGDIQGEGCQNVIIGDHYLGCQDGTRAAGGVYIFDSEGGDKQKEKGLMKKESEAVLICARPENASKDLELAEIPITKIVSIYDDDLEGSECTSLFSELENSSGSISGAKIVLGSSLRKLSALVVDALMSLSSTEQQLHDAEDTASGLAYWLLRYSRGKCASDIPRRSIAYSLFSASSRSRIVSHMLQQECKHDRPIVLVDHGANIGLLMLCATYGLKHGSFEVVCSEPDPAAVRAGLDLWSCCGLGESIRYQPGSAVNFNHPEDVSLVFFGQMLFRIPVEERSQLIDSAWRSLRTDGVLAFNELMNRTDAKASANLVSSDELFSYLPDEAELSVYLDFNNPVALTNVEAVPLSAYTSSENCIIAKSSKQKIDGDASDLIESVRKSTNEFRVTYITSVELSKKDIIARGSDSDKAYMNENSNMDWLKGSFIDYILGERTGLAGGDGTLLDSGCGNGRFAEELSKWYSVTGEDLSRGGIFKALERARERSLPIQYRLADSLAISDAFDVSFLRGPSYLEQVPTDSDDFRHAVEHMVRRSKKKLVYVSFSKPPFNTRNSFNCFMHDPENVERVFSDFGLASVSYEKGYIVAILKP